MWNLTFLLRNVENLIHDTVGNKKGWAELQKQAFDHVFSLKVATQSIYLTFGAINAPLKMTLKSVTFAMSSVTDLCIS